MHLAVKRSALALMPLGMLALWTFFLYQFSPSDIVDWLGASNGYIATLILSFLGGVSMFITVPYHLVLMTFAAGGLNPLLLGLVATIGQCGGDTTSYFVGYGGAHVLPQGLHKLVGRILAWCEGRPYWQVFLAVVVYGSISPLSNDFILIPLGMARYSYRRIMIPLEIGNLIFNCGAGLLGAYGLSSVLGA
jgi:membrane protein YqaA with SNARE-associated domain